MSIFKRNPSKKKNSSLTTPTQSISPGTQPPSLGANFLPDLIVTRYYLKKKAEQVKLCYKVETAEITSEVVKTGKNEGAVSLYEIKELRFGKYSKDFEKNAETKKLDLNYCYVLWHGMDFRLKSLSFHVESKKDGENWARCLEYLVGLKKCDSYIAKLDVWLWREYETFHDGINLKQLKDLTNRISFKISTSKLREKFQTGVEKSRNSDGNTLDYFGLSQLLSDFLHDQQIFTDCFGKYSLGRTIQLPEFEEFLRKEQNQGFNGSEFNGFFREYNKSGRKGVPFLSAAEAVNILFSKQNQIWNAQYDAIIEADMHRPLSHYWIAASHNTYLTGDQLSSESSIEAYARCLRQGCRCIELDCWDGNGLSLVNQPVLKIIVGPDGMPIIYHGRTLTTKISFLDVLKVIRDHAFVTNPYPVILSIENHCSVKQQKVMAKKFEEVLGRMLVTSHLCKDETQLPSPSAFLRRILIKCKKLPEGQESSEKEKGNSSIGGDSGTLKRSTSVPGSNNSDFQNDLSATVKTGKMYIQNNGQWEPYFFALTNEKLMYTEMESGKEDYDNDHLRRRSNHMHIEDLHFSKKWFHGKVQGGLRAAEERVKKFGVEGGFLVRQSDTFPGEFSLCFLSQNKAHHLRIKSNADQSQFYLIPSRTFDSLYTLISYYRRNPLDTRDFHVECFTKPVPQPESHESQPWFYPNAKYNHRMDRAGAEHILHRTPLNGAFLVRYANEDNVTVNANNSGGGRFVISFRIEKQLKHCRIKEEGRLLVVNSHQKFESIEKLVEYYYSHSFYKGLKLKHPITEELLKFSQAVGDPAGNVYTHPDYLDTNIPQVKVRALYTFSPDDGDLVGCPNPTKLLRFEKGDVITNVVKQETGKRWWIGDFGDLHQYFFPHDYVEEIEQGDSPFGELQKGSVSLGKADIEKGGDDNFGYIVRIWTPNNPLPFKAAVKTMREAKAWQEAINAAAIKVNNQNAQIDKIQRKNKIATEFSKLVIYCQTVPKVTPELVRSRGLMFYEMASYSELVAEKLMVEDPAFYVRMHEVQLSRVYPKAQRVDSSNYSPLKFWNAGCQLVALNYQKGDKPLQLNHGRFRRNGRCGYVLKPDFMFKRNFDPVKVRELAENGIKAWRFKITIIAARHLSRVGSNSSSSSKPVLSPYVDVEVYGADFDCQAMRTTKVVSDNGLNPFWKEKFTFTVQNPELALIRFAVMDTDSFGDSHFLGQATYPVVCLLKGYRSVPLENGFQEELLGSLLIHNDYSVL